MVITQIVRKIVLKFENEYGNARQAMAIAGISLICSAVSVICMLLVVLEMVPGEIAYNKETMIIVSLAFLGLGYIIADALSDLGTNKRFRELEERIASQQ